MCTWDRFSKLNKGPEKMNKSLRSTNSLEKSGADLRKKIWEKNNLELGQEAF